MDKLKELLGEELYNEVMEKVGDKHKIAIVSDGNWIPKDKFDNINTEKNTYKNQIEDLNEELGKLKKKAKGNEDIKATIEDLETDIENKEKEMKKLRKVAAITPKIYNYNPYDAEDVLNALDLEAIEVKGKEVLGLDGQVEAMKEKKPHWFKEDQPSGTGGSKGAGPKDEKEMLKESIGKRLAKRKRQQVETEQDAQSLYFKAE